MPADADGWGLIDQLGAWDCMLTKFATLKDVPAGMGGDAAGGETVC